MTARAPLARQTGGFTLVEVMVSLVLLSFASVVIGKQMLLAASAARSSGTTLYRTAAITAAVSWLDAMPYDLLTAGTTCTTVATPPFPHTRCTTINDISSKKRQVMVVVTPSGSSLLRPDTTVVVRTQPTGGNPLDY